MQNVEQNDAKCGRNLMQKLAEMWYILCGKNKKRCVCVWQGGLGHSNIAVQNVEQNDAKYGRNMVENLTNVKRLKLCSRKNMVKYMVQKLTKVELLKVCWKKDMGAAPFNCSQPTKCNNIWLHFQIKVTELLQMDFCQCHF